MNYLKKYLKYLAVKQQLGGSFDFDNISRPIIFKAVNHQIELMKKKYLSYEISQDIRVD